MQVTPPAARGERPRTFRIAVAVLLAFAVGAASTVCWSFREQHRRPATTASPDALGTPPTGAVPAPSPPAPIVKTSPRLTSPVRSARVMTASHDPDLMELELISRAQLALASEEFGSALTALAAHARRYPRGWLAEEREALRVQALASAGRTSESLRAAAAFGKRFPRSVLLQRLRLAGTPAADG